MSSRTTSAGIARKLCGCDACGEDNKVCWKDSEGSMWRCKACRVEASASAIAANDAKLLQETLAQFETTKSQTSRLLAENVELRGELDRQRKEHEKALESGSRLETQIQQLANKVEAQFEAQSVGHQKEIQELRDLIKSQNENQQKLLCALETQNQVLMANQQLADARPVATAGGQMNTNAPAFTPAWTPLQFARGELANTQRCIRLRSYGPPPVSDETKAMIDAHNLFCVEFAKVPKSLLEAKGEELSKLRQEEKGEDTGETQQREECKPREEKKEAAPVAAAPVGPARAAVFQPKGNPNTTKKPSATKPTPPLPSAPVSALEEAVSKKTVDEVLEVAAKSTFKVTGSSFIPANYVPKAPVNLAVAPTAAAEKKAAPVKPAKKEGPPPQAQPERKPREEGDHCEKKGRKQKKEPAPVQPAHAEKKAAPAKKEDAPAKPAKKEGPKPNRFVVLRNVPKKTQIDDCVYYCQPFGKLKGTEWLGQSHAVVEFKYLEDAEAVVAYSEFTMFSQAVRVEFYAPEREPREEMKEDPPVAAAPVQPANAEKKAASAKKEDAPAKPAKKEGSKPNRFVVLRNVPKKTQIDDCVYYCQPFGKVKRAEWLGQSQSAVVEFKYLEDAEAIVAYNEFTMFSKAVRVEFYIPKVVPVVAKEGAAAAPASSPQVNQEATPNAKAPIKLFGGNAADRVP